MAVGLMLLAPCSSRQYSWSVACLKKGNSSEEYGYCVSGLCEAPLLGANPPQPASAVPVAIG